MVGSIHTRAGTLLAATALLAATGGGYSQDAAPPAWVEGSTTLVVLPDTERYSDDYPHLFEAQTKWILEHHRERQIAHVLHLGDITQHDAPPEWKVVRRCFAMLDGVVPYALALGNHDYSGGERKSRIDEYFSLADMRKQSTFGGVFEEGKLGNSYHLFRVGEEDWIAVVLEFGPRDEVVAWANELLERHRDRLGIVITHAYLFRGNVRYDHLLGKQRASPHGSGNDGEQLWQKLVRRHPNVMVVFSGHVSTGGVGYLANEGDYGNTVHQIMADYEKGRRGGSAYLRLLEFLPNGKTVQMKTYSPALDRYLTDPLNQLTFELKLANRTTPRPVSSKPTALLSKAPIHRYGFVGEGGDAARIRDTVGSAHGQLQAADSKSRLDGRGHVVLEENGHVTLPRLLEGLEDVSLELWFTPTADRYKWASAVRLGDADDWLTYVFRTLTVHRAEIAVRKHNEDIQREVAVKPGEPLHVVVTYDHDGADGKPLLGYFRAGEPFGTMRIGLELREVEDTQNRIGPFTGEFDELRIYDYPLSAAEVRGNFAAGPDELRVGAARSGDE